MIIFATLLCEQSTGLSRKGLTAIRQIYPAYLQIIHIPPQLPTDDLNLPLLLRKSRGKTKKIVIYAKNGIADKGAKYRNNSLAPGLLPENCFF